MRSTPPLKHWRVLLWRCHSRYLPDLLPMLVPDIATQHTNPIRIVYVHDEWRQQLIKWEGLPAAGPPKAAPDLHSAPRAKWFQCFAARQKPQSPYLSLEPEQSSNLCPAEPAESRDVKGLDTEHSVVAAACAQWSRAAHLAAVQREVIALHRVRALPKVLNPSVGVEVTG